MPEMQIQEYVGRSLLFAIAKSYDEIWRDFNSRLRREHCNFLEAMILISLFFEPQGRARPSKLASVFGTSRANLSHGITRLEKLGLLQRALVAGDARGYELRLKPEGKKVALRLIDSIDRLEKHFETEIGSKEVERTIVQISALPDIYKLYRKK
jgi:DNA-binding MarR family transcriptional regulator